MLGSRPVPIRFRRRFELGDERMILTDEAQLEGRIRLSSISVGGEFFVRYVPQSRYFQTQELEITERLLDTQEISIANTAGSIVIQRTISAGFVTSEVKNSSVSHSVSNSGSTVGRIKLSELAGWSRRNSWFRGLALIILTIAIFYLLFQRIDLMQVLAFLSTVPPVIWVLATLLTFSFPIMSAARWHLILRAMGYNVDVRKCLLVIVGIWPISSISPAKSGDLLKAICLRNEIDAVVAAGSVLTERVLDLLVLAGFALAGGLVFQDGRIIVVASCMLLAVLVVLMLARLKVRWPIGKRWQGKLQDLFRSLQTFGQNRTLLVGILSLTVANWFASILQTKLLFDGVGASVPLGFTAAALPVAIFVGLIPVTFGGMGTRDSAMVVLFSTFASAPQALAVGILYSFFGYWLLAVLGLAVMKRALGY